MVYDPEGAPVRQRPSARRSATEEVDATSQFRAEQVAAQIEPAYDRGRRFHITSQPARFGSLDFELQTPRAIHWNDEAAGRTQVGTGCGEKLHA